MKLNHLIAVTALATLASGGAFAQTGGGTSGASPSSASDTAQSALGGAKDKAKDQKNSSGMQSGQTRKDVKGSSNNPITVTPPSQDDPNTRVNVDTDPADANAAVGQSGVSADASVNPPKQQTPTSKKKSGSGQ